MGTEEKIGQTSVLSDAPAQVYGDVPSHVAGYDLVERIGAGGYGEVWRAVGPGGLSKAVKILYGRQDGQQAELELKSLERVRELRHPFLLNIERIEVNDGRLIVVSELADLCMEKRFEQAARDGLRGIPRDELLGYLRDAADALDFMVDQGGLQHLDIKPGNLMLLGDHAKVGDFGLTKDISTRGVSLMAGFTPLYSSPEIFEGQPSNRSDQYSLAIVYQTMLTGQPPFAGRTAAQLTAQHLSSKPDLTPLQPADRPVIARALSKNPQARFENCRQFVQALSQRKGSNSSAATRQTVSEYTILSSNIKCTPVVNQEAIVASADSPRPVVTPISPTPESRLELSYRPTIFIAVGGMAGRILHLLKQRLQKAFGPASLPSFAMAYLDTDKNALADVCAENVEHGLVENELFHFPLRSLQDFRSAGFRALDWLSRRWLYNIPKTGQVEGIRPLGRLALVDQQDRVRPFLTDLVRQATSEPAVAATSKATSLEITTEPPDIFVIGSTTGGTGSGAVLDIGYLAKEICTELRFEQSRINGILLHASGAVRGSADVQEAGTISLLRELQHYCTPGAGGARGLTANQAVDQAGPFDHTYTVHLGDGLNEREQPTRLADIVDYMFINVATPNRAYFDSWRNQSSGEAAGSATAIRSFGSASIAEEELHHAQKQAVSLCQALTNAWANSACTANDEEFEQGALRNNAQSLLAELTLSGDQLRKTVTEILAGDAGEVLTSCARSQCELILAQLEPQGSFTNSTLSKITNELLQQSGKANSEEDKSLLAMAQCVVEESATPIDVTLGDLRKHVLGLVDGSLRFRGADEAINAMLADVSSTGKRMAQSLTTIVNDIKQTCSSVTKDRAEHPASSEEWRDGAVRQVIGQLCQQCCTYAIFHAVTDRIAKTRELLMELRTQTGVFKEGVARISKAFVLPGESSVTVTPADIQEFDRDLALRGEFRLSDLRDKSAEKNACVLLFESALTFCRSKIGASGAPDGQPPKQDRSFPKSATPLLANAGGGRRILALIPKSASIDLWKKNLTETFGDCVSVRQVQTNRVNVYCEIEGIEISKIIDQLLQFHPHIGEIADRIHTRNDVQW
ncbi:MAG: protein kinase [Pirellulales bacterium]|nr:protein kinase [Pirellulales bacterium]